MIIFLFLLPLIICQEVALVTNVEPNSFIMFYAPWCEHCKSMKVDWDKFNDKYYEQINILKIDCTESKNVCAQYGVSAYPMLLYVD